MKHAFRQPAFESQWKSMWLDSFGDILIVSRTVRKTINPRWREFENCLHYTHPETFSLTADLTSAGKHQDALVDDLLWSGCLAPIQLCTLWPLGPSCIESTVPDCPGILAPHGTVPRLLFICFISLHSYLPSHCAMLPVTLGWALCYSTTKRRVRKMKREQRRPNLISCIFSLGAQRLKVNRTCRLKSSAAAE